MCSEGNVIEPVAIVWDMIGRYLSKTIKHGDFSFVFIGTPIVYCMIYVSHYVVIIVNFCAITRLL